MSSVTRGCRRVTVDLPLELHDAIVRAASEAPAISVSEWLRRVAAHHAKVELPSLAQRRAEGLTLAGDSGKRFT